MWSVDIVTSNDDNRKLEALIVGVYQHLSCSLGGSVRVSRSQNARLEQIISILLDFSINLIGGNVHKLLDPKVLSTF